MLERTLSLKEEYNQFCAPANMEQYHLTLLKWDKFRRIHQACGNYEVQQIEPAAAVMTTKLNKYLQILLCKKPVIYASILDPWIKMKFFEKHDLTLARFGTSESQLSTIFEDKAKGHFNGSMNPLTWNIEKEATGLLMKFTPPHHRREIH
ncbi:hypothetical protein O181_013974 [Austropuccinia psidii MF-1]|uniref:Uncharacterized protein n=1 Tax=Austropuccinia psidii MF-1 TaxID=1389203 RepID=A0A9Q3BZA3_9BASI|nr:hypothetical protein [Austropuccinia psidii MF-1]